MIWFHSRSIFFTTNNTFTWFIIWFDKDFVMNLLYFERKNRVFGIFSLSSPLKWLERQENGSSPNIFTSTFIFKTWFWNKSRNCEILSAFEKLRSFHYGVTENIQWPKNLTYEKATIPIYLVKLTPYDTNKKHLKHLQILTCWTNRVNFCFRYGVTENLDNMMINDIFRQTYLQKGWFEQDILK